VNPSGVVAYKGSKSPDAAWEFIKCYTGPQLQAMIASLKASMPANKEVLTGQYATSFEGGKTFADALAYAHLKPSFAGYNEFSSALQDELDTKVFNDKTLTAKAALGEVTPALQKLLGK
jgi:multiple sugar transport system substrate-binding protein